MDMAGLERGNGDRRLDGRAAIVTGAGCAGDLPGTGVAIALLFARHGARVAVVDLDPERAENTRRLIDDIGGESMTVTADISKGTDCERAVAEVVAAYGGVDILVNNAAIVAGGTLFNTSEEDWERVLGVNLSGVVYMTRHAMPHLVESDHASVVNMSSIAGLRGFGNFPYAATKGGVIGLTPDLAYTHGKDGVRVNCITPGHLHTPMGSGGGEELRELRRTMGLLPDEGDAWDAAWAALFLASDESRWITGVVLPVDAGTTATTGLALSVRR